MKLRELFYVAMAAVILLTSASSCNDDDKTVKPEYVRIYAPEGQPEPYSPEFYIDGVRYNGSVFYGSSKWIDIVNGECSDVCDVVADITTVESGEYVDLVLRAVDLDLSSYPGNPVEGKIALPTYLKKLFTREARLLRGDDEKVYDGYEPHYSLPLDPNRYMIARTYSAVLDVADEGIRSQSGSLVKSLELKVYYSEVPAVEGEPFYGPVIALAPGFENGSSGGDEKDYESIRRYSPYKSLQPQWTGTSPVPEDSFFHIGLEVDGRDAPEGSFFTYSEALQILMNTAFLPGWKNEYTGVYSDKSVYNIVKGMSYISYLYADHWILGGSVGLDNLFIFNQTDGSNMKVFLRNPCDFMLSSMGKSGLKNESVAVRSMPARMLFIMSPYIDSGMHLKYSLVEDPTDSEFRILSVYADAEMAKTIFKNVFLPLFAEDERQKLEEVLKGYTLTAPYADELIRYAGELPKWIENATRMELGLRYVTFYYY